MTAKPPSRAAIESAAHALTVALEDYARAEAQASAHTFMAEMRLVSRDGTVVTAFTSPDLVPQRTERVILKTLTFEPSEDAPTKVTH